MSNKDMEHIYICEFPREINSNRPKKQKQKKKNLKNYQKNLK